MNQPTIRVIIIRVTCCVSPIAAAEDSMLASDSAVVVSIGVSAAVDVMVVLLLFVLLLSVIEFSNFRI